MNEQIVPNNEIEGTAIKRCLEGSNIPEEMGTYLPRRSFAGLSPVGLDLEGRAPSPEWGLHDATGLQAPIKC